MLRKQKFSPVVVVRLVVTFFIGKTGEPLSLNGRVSSVFHRFAASVTELAAAISVSIFAGAVGHVGLYSSDGVVFCELGQSLASFQRSSIDAFSWSVMCADQSASGITS